MKIENILNAVIVKTNNSLKGSICDVLPTGKYFFYIFYMTLGYSQFVLLAFLFWNIYIYV
jgi:hypothetical protein